MVANADSLTRLAEKKQREVSQHKREIKKHRYRLQIAARELEIFKQQLADLGIEYIGAGEIHGRTKHP